MRVTNDLFIVNIVVLLKLKKFVVQNVRLPRYSGLSSSYVMCLMQFLTGTVPNPKLHEVSLKTA